MKITYILETLSIKGGIERITVDKMNSLQAVPGYDVSLILVYDYHAPAFYELSENVKVVSLNIQKTDNYLLKFKTFYQVGKKVKKAVNELGSDIIICSGLLGNILFATNIFACRTIYESHGPRHHMMLKFLLPLVERKCDVVVTLTEGDKQEYRIAKRVEVIPNFTKMHTSSLADLDAHRCLCIGRLSHQKNHARLLKIWSRVVAEHADWHLDIVGEGPAEEHLRQLVTQLHIEKSVSILPPSVHIENYYRQSSILLLTSLFEGLPMVMIEALNFALPMVSVDCDYGPREIIENGVNGFITAYDSDEAMVEAISRLMSDAALRKQMGEKSLQMSTRFSEENIIRQWTTLFASL